MLPTSAPQQVVDNGWDDHLTMPVKIAIAVIVGVVVTVLAEVIAKRL